MKFLDTNQFKAGLKAGQTPADPIRKTYATEVKDLGENQTRFIITTEAVDRHGDTVSADGWQVDNFMKNPVVLFAHDYDSPPVAKCIAITKMQGGKIAADVEWPEKGLYPFADTIRGMVKTGFLNATSVGFIALAYEHPSSEDSNRSEWDYDFTSQELLEFSVVPVPANPEALVVARALVAQSDAPKEEAMNKEISDRFEGIEASLKKITDKFEADAKAAEEKALADAAAEKAAADKAAEEKAAAEKIEAEKIEASKSEESEGITEEQFAGMLKLIDDWEYKNLGRVAD